MAFSLTPTSDHHRYCSNMTPDVIIESSIPTPESNTSAPGALNSNSSQNRTNFHSFNPDNVAMGSPDDQSAASSSGGGGGGGVGVVNGLPGLPDSRGSNVIMETSFRVMSPESEMAAASLRTLQGISRLGCDPNNRQPGGPSAPSGAGGSVVTTGYAALNSPFYTQSSIYNNNSSTSRPATACHEYNPPQITSQPPEIGFKTVDQSSGLNVSSAFGQGTTGTGGGGVGRYMPLAGSGSTTHIIEQPISQRPYSYEYPLTPPFPHPSQLTHGSRSHTPCSPPDQNFSAKKNQTLSQSSISLPAIKGGGGGSGMGGVVDQMGSSSHHHHHHHQDIDHDCISLRHDSIRRSKASEVDDVTDMVAEEKSITGFGGGGASGGGTMVREGTAEVQPVLTWGFQLWECFSDTKWCIITGFFPCITEFILSQNFGLQRIGLSFVFSALGIVTLLLVQLFLVTDNHDSLNVGLNDGFICNLLLYALFLLRLYLAFKLRSRIRNEYQIEGNPVSDCCIACLCSYCALCQMKQHYDYYDGSDSEDESPGPPRMPGPPSHMQHHSHSQHSRPPAVISYPKSRSVETCLDASVAAKNRGGVGGSGLNHRFMYTDNNRSSAKQSPLCHSGGRVYDNSFVHQNSAPRGGCSLGASRCQPSSYHCRHHGCCRNTNPPPPNLHQQVLHTCVVPQQCRSVWVTDAPNQAVLQDGTRINMPRY